MKEYRIYWAEVEEDVIRAESLADAKQKVKDMQRNVDMTAYWANEDVPRATIWEDITIYWTADDGDDYCDIATWRWDPPEPPCWKTETHEWRDDVEVVGGEAENPGVFFGAGAAVSVHEYCAKCGALRIRETNATRPDTGAQGYERIYYDSVAKKLEELAMADGEGLAHHMVEFSGGPPANNDVVDQWMEAWKSDRPDYIDGKFVEDYEEAILDTLHDYMKEN